MKMDKQNFVVEMHFFVVIVFVNCNFLGAQYSDEEFADVNPNKRVPALKDGDMKLFER